MKQLVYRKGFHTVLLILLLLLNISGLLYCRFLPDPGNIFGLSFDWLSETILFIVIIASFPFVLVFTVLLYILLNRLGESQLKSDDRSICPVVSFSILSVILLIPLSFSIVFALNNNVKEVITDWHTNGNKKIGVVYRDNDIHKTLLCRTFYSETGKVQRQEKIDGKIVLEVIYDRSRGYIDPPLLISGKNLTAKEHNLADLGKFPFPDFPEGAFDINYSLSFIDYPHEDYSVTANYKISGADINSIERINIKEEKNGHSDIIAQDYKILSGDTVIVKYERNKY